MDAVVSAQALLAPAGDDDQNSVDARALYARCLLSSECGAPQPRFERPLTQGWCAGACENVLWPWHRSGSGCPSRETEGTVFRDEEFIAHLERVAASEDDLPREGSE